jgi:hypothetical protein
VNDIETGRRRLGMTHRELWLGYLELGGNGSLPDVLGWLTGGIVPPIHDHDTLAHVLNEVFSDQGLNHPVRYSDSVAPF